MSSYPVQKSEEEWRAQLKNIKLKDPDLPYKVLREQATEAPTTGEYDKLYPKHDSKDVFACNACHTPLYTASKKYDSGCGWPAFWDALPGAVERHEDGSGFMRRTEIRCTKCGGHLGHVFKGEGHGNPIDERHCVNSVSLKFGDYMPQEANGNHKVETNGESKDSNA
ncbi:MAG: hypothetical protein M1831_000755 [Alyxoria varia]|nr:MAG: hypothetical protein M1831_000755 [Alyxoria varia]